MLHLWTFNRHQHETAEVATGTHNWPVQVLTKVIMTGQPSATNTLAMWYPLTARNYGMLTQMCHTEKDHRLSTAQEDTAQGKCK